MGILCIFNSIYEKHNTPIINLKQKTTFSHVCSAQFDTTGLDIITRDMTHTLLSQYAVIECHKMAVGGTRERKTIRETCTRPMQ